MTDRVPGAPGQYILTVSAAEAQKILTGEPVAVTLKRDDQPLVEGTPYNKASVLPDELASILCPGVLDPTPADAFSGVLKKAAPYNYAHNSDFTQWVNQAGFGESHAGSVKKYAGDRWILDSGTVTGDARADGNGYTNIKLNGTIRQIVANAPDVGTAAIEMASGTADISYANGVITITSNGGVIENVRLFKGNYTADNMASYQPKGYCAELAECLWYYQKYQARLQVISFAVAAVSKRLNAFITLQAPMRTVPSIMMNNISVADGVGTPSSATFDNATFDENIQIAKITVLSSAETVNTYQTYLLRLGIDSNTPIGSIEFSADL